MSFSPEIILGPPGTGKTHYLLNEIEEALSNKIPPHRIGCLAFTKKAAQEAANRAANRFNYSLRELPYFRTLHSLAFRLLGLNQGRVLGSKGLQEFGKIMGLTITGKSDRQEQIGHGTTRGDRALFLSTLSRIRCVSLEEQYADNPLDLGWFELDRVHRGLAKFKEVRGVFDFTDMVVLCLQEPVFPELDLLVVDESQDLSQLQWQLVERLSQHSKRTVVAGDDDQAIFQWAGADVDYFIDLTGPTKVLDKSYRIPKEVQTRAQSVVKLISSRKAKDWEPREGTGAVLYHSRIDHLDFSTGSWLMLARNKFLLADVRDKCYREGFAFIENGRRSVSEASVKAIQTWENLRKGEYCEAEALKGVLRYTAKQTKGFPEEGQFKLVDLRQFGVQTTGIWHEAFLYMSHVERSYLIAALRRGEPLTKEPRIILSTIHGAKGGEADNVLLITDVSPKTFEHQVRIPDNEHRVLYVGMTRAKETLHILLPRTRYYFSAV